ncbi:MAG: hypothetical protein J6X66_06625 [Lachnospiraceae bacterium]|nr:hypothetical protein [Lachnospiraceae bacterium]
MADQIVKQRKISEEKIGAVQNREKTAELPSFKQQALQQGEINVAASGIFAERYTKEYVPGKELKTISDEEYNKSLESKMLFGMQKGKKAMQ